MHKQAGIAIIDGLLIIVVAAGLVGIGGYTVWHRYDKKTAISPPNPLYTTVKLDYTSPTLVTPSAPAINSASGLNSALQTLNETNVTAGSVDSAQVSTEAAGF